MVIDTYENCFTKAAMVITSLGLAEDEMYIMRCRRFLARVHHLDDALRSPDKVRRVFEKALLAVSIGLGYLNIK